MCLGLAPEVGEEALRQVQSFTTIVLVHPSGSVMVSFLLWSNECPTEQDQARRASKSYHIFIPYYTRTFQQAFF